MEYTEHEKLKKVSDRSQAIGEFIEWLRDNNMAICEWVDTEGQWVGHSVKSIQNLLAEYFEIDQKKLEEEKQDMLEECRKLNEK